VLINHFELLMFVVDVWWYKMRNDSRDLGSYSAN